MISRRPVAGRAGVKLASSVGPCRACVLLLTPSRSHTMFASFCVYIMCCLKVSMCCWMIFCQYTRTHKLTNFGFGLEPSGLVIATLPASLLQKIGCLFYSALHFSPRNEPRQILMQREREREREGPRESCVWAIPPG